MPEAMSPTVPSVAGLVKRWRSSEKIWLPLWMDANGSPITNTAGQLPVKPYHEMYAVGVYHFIVFKAYTDAQFKAEINALNSVPWKTWPKGSAWMSEIHTSGPITIGTGTGEQVHYVIRCINRPGGWTFQHPDVGYTYKSGNELNAFVSDDEKVAYIGNLDGTGGDKGNFLSILGSETKQEFDFNSLAL
jgi:hypothetical protein